MYRGLFLLFCFLGHKTQQQATRRGTRRLTVEGEYTANGDLIQPAGQSTDEDGTLDAVIRKYLSQYSGRRFVERALCQPLVPY